MANKTALITGASRGIGAAAARVFAQSGYDVVLAARDGRAINEVAASIQRTGGRALAIPCDVTDPASVERMLARTLEEFGRLDAAFNNAGSGAPPVRLAEIEPDTFEDAVRVNLTGTFLCMRAEIAAMLRTGGGAIVNMSSTAGLQGVSGLAPYSAAKHAVIGLSKTAALDYAADGIRVNVLAPGPIGTERIPPNERERIGQFVPVKRVGTPEEVGELALWLCSEHSTFITGTVVTIDGGRLAGTPAFAR